MCWPGVARPIRDSVGPSRLGPVGAVAVGTDIPVNRLAAAYRLGQIGTLKLAQVWLVFPTIPLRRAAALQKVDHTLGARGQERGKLGSPPRAARASRSRARPAGEADARRVHARKFPLGGYSREPFCLYLSESPRRDSTQAGQNLAYAASSRSSSPTVPVARLAAPPSASPRNGENPSRAFNSTCRRAGIGARAGPGAAAGASKALERTSRRVFAATPARRASSSSRANRRCGRGSTSGNWRRTPARPACS